MAHDGKPVVKTTAFQPCATLLTSPAAALVAAHAACVSGPMALDPITLRVNSGSDLTIFDHIL